MPLASDGVATTVTVVVDLQPVLSKYVITDVPTATLAIVPDEEPIVATDVVPLLHVPPPVASASVDVAGRHIRVVPVIDAGKEFTVNAFVA